MPRTITETELRVFVASPGDVKDERDRLERVVHEMNVRGGAAHHAGVRLKLLRWETDVAPDAGRPQGVVSDQLPPEDWDIFVGILWLRFGSDTGEIDPVTKQPYRSGTDEEFKAAYRLRESRGDGFPKVMFYRCTRPPADLLRFDLTQFARVQQFFEGFLPGGQHPGLVQTYSAAEEFERMVRQHLGMWIADLATSPRATTPAAPSPAPTPRMPSDAERQAAFTKYLKNLSRACNALPLAALDEDVSPHRRAEITLNRVYVALDTTTRVPLTDAEKGERAKRVLPGRDEDCPLAVYPAAAQNARLVIIGDPGSGKSSFANNLAVLLISARLSRADLPAPWTHGALLPVRVLLRELAPTLPDEKQLQRLSADGRARVLSDAVREFVAKIPAAFDAADATPLVLAALDAGECLVVFDGLDEVAPPLRRLTRGAVEAFAARYPDNRFLVTCRVRSYQGDARLPSFEPVTLAPFDEDKIAAFVRAWYAALADLGQMPREQASQRAANLQVAVGRMQELAGTPLLLTTMAIVHTAQVELPRERARLYQRCVEVLLRRWHKHKQGESPVLTELGLDEAALLEALWLVAFEAHARGKKNQAADLPKRDVLALLAKKMDGSFAKAEHFLQHVDERAGLLVARGGVDEDEPVFAFPHRTFQEFLAGCYLALGESDFGRQLRARLSDGDKWAHAAQLGAEHLLYNNRDKWKVLSALYWLCPVAEPRHEVDWRGMVWAGNIAAEMGAPRIREDTDNPDGGDAFLKRLIPRLVALVERGVLSPLERAEAGVALAKLGDPRLGVGIITLPLRAGDYSPRSEAERGGTGMGVPDLVWCEIPAGPFTMGSDQKRDSPASDDETSQHEEKSITRAYLIGKYPVTNAQFYAFVRAGGYADERYWQEATAQGWWKEGRFKGQYDNEPRDRPYDFGTPFNLDNHPVVGVSWYEAVAFCRWLTDRLQVSGYKLQVWRNDQLETWDLRPETLVRLPTEAELEKAARGTDGRIYPWNGELTPQHANFAETGIGATSAVGVFPQGASPYGALDMSGNVWEWCSTKWVENYKKYDKTMQERERLDGTDYRVLRGGSFRSVARSVRCACRGRDGPGYGFRYFGFRVVVSPVRL